MNESLAHNFLAETKINYRAVGKTKLSQSEKILDHMKAGNSITPLDALENFGCFRLGARIADLKKLGYDIRSELVSRNGKHYAKYWLYREEQPEMIKWRG